MVTYSVIVGNVGEAFSGASFTRAQESYNAYKKLSQEGYGRIAGESVCMFRDGALLYEYMGNIDEEYEIADIPTE